MTNYTLNIVPEYTVGVTELTNNVKVWPNPISGIVNINTPSNSGVLRIMSIDGRCVYQEKYFTNNIQFDSETLSNGTYVITTVPTTTTFTYTTTTSGTITSAADTGTVTCLANSWTVTDFLSQGSTTAYNVPGNADYNADNAIDFIIASTEDPTA
jgi:hypothetical protein